MELLPFGNPLNYSNVIYGNKGGKDARNEKQDARCGIQDKKNMMQDQEAKHAVRRTLYAIRSTNHELLRLET